MRRCDRDMPCVKGIFKFKCRVDGHIITKNDECCISDDNPKLLELYPIPEIPSYCGVCEYYEEINDWVYEGVCPNTPGEYHQYYDGCGKFVPRKYVLEMAKKQRFSPWDKE